MSTLFSKKNISPKKGLIFVRRILLYLYLLSFFSLWHTLLIAHPEQPQLHEPVPFFLSLTIFLIARYTTNRSIIPTTIEPVFAIIHVIIMPPILSILLMNNGY